ncbi:MAG: hypothetical protein KC561_05555, partial [Myxococcales bacterium]|nr:hypothetical protein [Myxococcales bacterium]
SATDLLGGSGQTPSGPTVQLKASKTPEAKLAEIRKNVEAVSSIKLSDAELIHLIKAPEHQQLDFIQEYGGGVTDDHRTTPASHPLIGRMSFLRPQVAQLELLYQSNQKPVPAKPTSLVSVGKGADKLYRFIYEHFFKTAFLGRVKKAAARLDKGDAAGRPERELAVIATLIQLSAEFTDKIRNTATVEFLGKDALTDDRRRQFGLLPKQNYIDLSETNVDIIRSQFLLALNRLAPKMGQLWRTSPQKAKILEQKRHQLKLKQIEKDLIESPKPSGCMDTMAQSLDAFSSKADDSKKRKLGTRTLAALMAKHGKDMQMEQWGAVLEKMGVASAKFKIENRGGLVQRGSDHFFRRQSPDPWKKIVEELCAENTVHFFAMAHHRAQHCVFLVVNNTGGTPQLSWIDQVYSQKTIDKRTFDWRMSRVYKPKDDKKAAYSEVWKLDGKYLKG